MHNRRRSKSIAIAGLVGLCACRAGTDALPPQVPDAHPAQSLYAFQSPGYEAVANYANSDIEHAATALGQFAVILPADRMLPMCTAFAVQPDLVFTAKHCLHPKLPDGTTLPDEDVVGVTFLMGRIAQQDKQETYELRLTPLAIGASDAEQDDYVVFKATRSFPAIHVQYPRLGKDPVGDEKLNLLSYPSMMQQLQISTDHCRTATAPIEGALIRHKCATEGGSSGAPIFDEHFNVIGIHTRSGYDARDPKSANLGVLMSHIVAANKAVADFLRQPPRNAVPGSPVGLENAKVVLDTNLGDKLLLADGNWFIKRGQSTGAPSRLLPQQSSNDRVVLWDSVADRLYDIPKEGGAVRARGGTAAEWSTVGFTTSTK
jgi:V8-like Glu-specific endopeptidase